MASFALFVQRETVGTPLIAELLRFSRAALELGHRIDHIFFYQDAVYGITNANDVPSDEPNWAEQLIDFCQRQQIPLLFCATAAEKRGVVSFDNVFIQAGLAEFAMRLESCDQVVGF